jgi:hypothetical protein
MSQHPGQHRGPVSSFADALNLIASGSGDEKVRWIAERDPDWFVDHLLRHTLVLYPYEPEGGRIDRRLLDQAIASIALRDCAALPLREAV